MDGHAQGICLSIDGTFCSWTTAQDLRACDSLYTIICSDYHSPKNNHVEVFFFVNFANYYAPGGSPYLTAIHAAMKQMFGGCFVLLMF
jgi:hypothetical protein